MSKSISVASGRRVCRTQWRHILQTLACCRLIARQRVALASDVVRARRDGWPRRLRSGGDTCPLSLLDKLLAHKTALFDHQRRRWLDLFGASFEVLLYDLTSDKRRYRNSREKRRDCVEGDGRADRDARRLSACL
jgi:hypothetical protein